MQSLLLAFGKEFEKGFDIYNYSISLVHFGLVTYGIPKIKLLGFSYSLFMQIFIMVNTADVQLYISFKQTKRM